MSNKPSKYPMEQEVLCAFCGTPAVRIVHSRVNMKTLHYCNADCKKNRIIAVRAGRMEKAEQCSQLPVQEAHERGNWGDLSGKPKRNINKISQPTKYDQLYGSGEVSEPAILSFRR